MDKQIYCRFVKMDAATRIVKGWASQEVVDKSREIMDYEGSKPYFVAWTDQVEKDSGGKSKGNVRAMHQPIAAGKIVSFECDDAAKAFWIEAEIVDDAEWAKCEKGVYTGFSIGGSYVRKWDDPEHKGCKRFIANPAEVSVVDNPCCGTAVFKYRTTEGVEQLRKFESSMDAVAYFAQEFERLKGGKSEVVDVIVKRSPTLDVLIKNTELAKGMGDVGELAYIIAALNSVRIWLKAEAEWEDDNSAIPGQLAETVKTLSGILRDLVAEETSELTDDLDVVLLASTQTEGLEKSAMNEEQIKKYLADNGYVTKAVHDATLTKATEAETLAKAVQVKADKAEADIVELTKAVKTQTQFIEALSKRLTLTKVATREVAKGADAGSGAPADATIDVSKVDKAADHDATRAEVYKSILAGGGHAGTGGSAEATTAAAIA